MGKASRRKRGQREGAARDTGPGRAPYVARPFEGLPGETDWVAMREIVPAATAEVRLALPGADGARNVRLVTVLPGAVPALHRADGTVLVALQSRTSSGDASRDVAQAVMTATVADPGTPVTSVRPATEATPRMQQLLLDEEPLAVQVQEDFGFWVEGDLAEAPSEVRASVEQTNASAVPTEPVPGLASTYWCRMGDRAYVRWILPDDEDAATTALARLQAAGEHTLGEGTVLLGAFRAAGLLVPVLEVDPATPAAEHGPAMVELAGRYAEALERTEPLSPQERRARDGIVSRQVTLR